MLTKEKLVITLIFDASLELNLDVISENLEQSPVSHLIILLRFTKGFHRLLNSDTGGFSFLQVLLETFMNTMVASSSIAHRVTNTERAPAAKKARAIPTTLSPLKIVPRPL